MATREFEYRVDLAPTGEARILIPPQEGMTFAIGEAIARGVAEDFRVAVKIEWEGLVEAHSHGPDDVFAHRRVSTR